MARLIQSLCGLGCGFASWDPAGQWVPVPTHLPLPTSSTTKTSSISTTSTTTSKPPSTPSNDVFILPYTDPPHPLSLESASTPASFPSPASSFIPPPVPNANEFAIKLPRTISNRKRDTSGAVKPISTTGVSETDKTHLSQEQDVMDDNSNTPIALEPSKGLPTTDRRKSGEGKLAGKDRPISDPKGSLGREKRLSEMIVDQNNSVPPVTPKSKHFSTPPGLQNVHGSPSIPPPLGSPRGGPSYYSAIAESKRSSLASNRPAPTSPTPSRHSSLLPTRHASKRYSSNLNPASMTTSSPQQQRKRASHILVKIRDFAFPQDDERHSAVKRLKISSSSRNSYAASDKDKSEKRKSSGSSWSGFFTASAAKFGFGAYNSKRSSRLSGTSSSPNMQSQQLYDEPGSSSSISGESEQYQSYDEDEDMDYAPEPEREFVPGYYRAVYSFEPEGTAEMALQEDQEVKCLARGGGVGWVIAVKEAMPGSRATQALVPESYLEFLRYFEEGDMGIDLGGDDPGTPKPANALSS